MRKCLSILVLIGVPAVIPRCWGQGTPDQLNFQGATFEGFQFYGVSAFLNHSEYSYPQQSITASSTQLNSRTNFGVSGTVGWQRLRGKLNFSARYTGSYYRDVHNTAFNRPGHSANLSVTRPLGRKWTVDFSGAAQVLSLEQRIFESSYLGGLSQSQASVGDLGAAMSIGQFSSAQTGMQLQTASSGIPITSAILLGNNLMTYNARASLSYQPTSRLRISFGSFAAGGQHLSGESALAANYATPHSLGGDAGVSLQYSLSPRTEIGLGISETYVRSSLQHGYSTNLEGSFSRKMTTHWFVGFSAGGVRSGISYQTSGAPPPLQVTFSASTAYRLRTITFVSTYSQSGSDQSTGLLGRNRNVQAAGNWRPLRRTWSIGASYDRNETTATGFGGLSRWRVSGNFSRTLPWNLMLATSYAFLGSHGFYLGFPSESTVTALRVSIGWVPARRRSNSTQSDPVE